MTWLREPPTLSHHSTRFCVLDLAEVEMKVSNLSGDVM